MLAEYRMAMVTPIGILLLHASREHLCGIDIFADEADPALIKTPHQGSLAASKNPVLQQALLELDQYFAGHRQEFRLPLDLTGQPQFRRRILDALQKVPYGTTITYGTLSAQAGFPQAARAVGQAMAANPLPIIIPCHRVVAAGGQLGGYSGGRGVQTKRWLLEFEQRNRLQS